MFRLQPWLAGALGTLAAIAAVAPLPAIAQSQSEADSLRDMRTLDDPDPFGGNAGTGTSGAMDLIQRILLNNGRSLNEFDRDQAEQLDDAAAEFRRRQQQEIRDRESPGDRPTPADASSR